MKHISFIVISTIALTGNGYKKQDSTTTVPPKIPQVTNKTPEARNITSAITHRKWLDRNLGAPSGPSASDDWANYGDLFQRGREVDGHQLIKRASTTISTTAVEDRFRHQLFL